MSLPKHLNQTFYPNATCDVCGATGPMHGERDVWEVELGKEYDRISSSDRLFRISDKERFGCDQHPVVTVCYNLDGTIAVTLPAGRTLPPNCGSLSNVIR